MMKQVLLLVTLSGLATACNRMTTTDSHGGGNGNGNGNGGRLPDECVCGGSGNFYSPTSDCSGFFQYADRDNAHGSVINCGSGLLFDPSACTCNNAGAFTCPNTCSTSQGDSIDKVDELALQSYQAYLDGNYDEIDWVAVKQYMSVNGLTADELAMEIGLSDDEAYQLNTLV